MLKAFVETTMERTVAPAGRLNFLHEISKPLSIFIGD